MGAKGSKEKKKKPLPKGGTITPLDRATLDLKNSRDRLSRYRTKLNLDAAKLASRAKALHADGNTSYALKIMKLRKYKLQEADRVEEQLLTVLRMVDKISEKQNEQEVIAAMKRGKDALQILHDEMSIDDVMNLMDDIRDQDEVEKKINEMLGEEGLRVVEELGGDEDILAELNQLEEEIKSEAAVVTQENGSAALPNVPSKPLPTVEEPTTSTEEKRVAVPS
jgi:hypothetical protein